MRVGDTVKLPSGMRVTLRVPAEPGRPWTAIETQAGWLWHVCREHGLDHAGVSFYTHESRAHPLQLDEADAKALANALNSVR